MLHICLGNQTLEVRQDGDVLFIGTYTGRRGETMDLRIADHRSDLRHLRDTIDNALEGRPQVSKHQATKAFVETMAAEGYTPSGPVTDDVTWWVLPNGGRAYVRTVYRGPGDLEGIWFQGVAGDDTWEAELDDAATELQRHLED